MQLLSDREHSASRGWLVSSALWLVLGTTLGLIDAIHLAAPDLLGSVSWLHFGRARPMHVNAVTFGFVATGLIGSTLYMLPMVLKTRLQGERLANLAMWLWSAAVVGGTISLAMGETQAREYAEWTWPFDLLLTGSMVLLLICCFRTIFARNENVLYVSVWYIAGALLWTSMMYPIGNVLWQPQTGSVSGIMDAILLWFYGHNIFGLFLTPLSVAIFYYLVPRLARAPLYSHVLSHVGFWGLLFFYTHIGTHHLLQAPVPTWLKEISIVDSVAMLIPVTTSLVNIWLTMRGRLANVRETPAGRIVFAASVWYFIVSTQGSLQSLPSVQRYTHFTQWVVAHAHIAVLGFAGLTALAGTWYVLPRTVNRRIFSEMLVDVQYWLLMIGVTGFFVTLTAAGLAQGHAWHNGEPVYNTLSMIAPYMVWRLLIGVLVWVAALIGLYNVVQTIRRGEPEQP
ncbi:MAG: cbb3-type cytochrome c oxidase subunit I [Armatimonadetes bacterium]|nr:cbb3-type cytochrome c oxidase subunit I [Armatimonadota bacterium]